MTWGQFHKAAKHKILLSLKNLGLAEMGYQPKYHAMYIGSDWFSAKFCLASKFAKQNFLLNSFMKLAPGCVLGVYCDELEQLFILAPFSFGTTLCIHCALLFQTE